jgi:hypothetical protein
MGKYKESPRYNVISMRISEKELKNLKQLMAKTHKNASHIMREAMSYFAVHQTKEKNMHA